jgi:hypothetical protein
MKDDDRSWIKPGGLAAIQYGSYLADRYTVVRITGITATLIKTVDGRSIHNRFNRKHLGVVGDRYSAARLVRFDDPAVTTYIAHEQLEGIARAAERMGRKRGGDATDALSALASLRVLITEAEGRIKDPATLAPR